MILGIKMPPETLIHQFTQKITLSLDYPSLVNLIKEEILPSIMIRESILLLFDGQPQAKTFLRTGVNDEECQKLIQSTTATNA